MGSALLMIVSQYGFSAVLEQPGLRLDPSRIAAQVVSGIGFIGAGTIIFHRQIVRGLTTAASLWATAGIGLAVGAGMYGTAAAATVLALVALEGLSLVFRGLGARRMAVSFTASDREAVGRAIDGIPFRGAVHRLVRNVFADERHGARVSRVARGDTRPKAATATASRRCCAEIRTCSSRRFRDDGHPARGRSEVAVHLLELRIARQFVGVGAGDALRYGFALLCEQPRPRTRAGFRPERGNSWVVRGRCGAPPGENSPRPVRCNRICRCRAERSSRRGAEVAAGACRGCGRDARRVAQAHDRNGRCAVDSCGSFQKFVERDDSYAALRGGFDDRIGVFVPDCDGDMGISRQVFTGRGVGDRIAMGRRRGDLKQQVAGCRAKSFGSARKGSEEHTYIY